MYKRQIQIISHVVAVKLLDDPDDNRPIVQCFFFQNLMLNMAAVQLLFVVFVFCLHFIHRQLMEMCIRDRWISKSAMVSFALTE